MNQDTSISDALMAKAAQAAVAAKLFLEYGDADGAADRAYYAMFNAARAALFSNGFEAVRTHKGLMMAFERFLRENNPEHKELGRLLRRAHEAMRLADYTSDSVDMDEARELAEQAAVFVAAMRDGFACGGAAG